MTDRPILFSAPMLRALLAGEKTQTRRLAWRGRRPVYSTYFEAEMPSGPLIATIWQKVRPGDRLWVKETRWRNGGYVATSDSSIKNEGKIPSIFMPRWASRLTLIVTEKRIERLQEISEADAVAEGVKRRLSDTYHGFYKDYSREGYGDGCTFANDSYRTLWDSLHKPGNRWADNPEIVALTFEVVCANIDREPA